MKLTQKDIIQLTDNVVLKVAKQEQGHRKHLGASILGQACDLKLYFIFRWAKLIKHSATKLRLFNRGHREEPVIIEELRQAGFTVLEKDEHGDQFKVKSDNSHFGGAVDGFVYPPKKFKQTKYLLELKTNKTGGDFNKLVKEGVRSAKTQHFIQMCVYGYLSNVQKAVYICVNKNNDERHIEIVNLSDNIAKDYLEKANRIIQSPMRPKAISKNPRFWICKMCDFHGICHKNEQIEKNCRSCSFAYPASEKRWICAKHKSVIPPDFIPKGCNKWTPI